MKTFSSMIDAYHGEFLCSMEVKILVKSKTSMRKLHVQFKQINCFITIFPLFYFCFDWFSILFTLLLHNVISFFSLSFIPTLLFAAVFFVVSDVDSKLISVNKQLSL